MEIRAEKGETKKKVNLGWHRDRKENPMSAPSIHVGALVGAGSLWTRESKNNCEKNITESNWITPTGRQVGRHGASPVKFIYLFIYLFFDMSPTSLHFKAREKNDRCPCG